MLTIYSKPDCKYCLMTKNYLDSLQIPFQEIDISQDFTASEFIKSAGHTTVPQIYKDGKLFIEGGFSGLMVTDIDLL